MIVTVKLTCEPKEGADLRQFETDPEGEPMVSTVSRQVAMMKDMLADQTKHGGEFSLRVNAIAVEGIEL